MKNYIRIWKELDLADIAQHLIVAGQQSAECYHCHTIGLDFTTVTCPHCNTHFKYMGFRRKDEVNFLKRFKDEMPYLTFIDFDDFKRGHGKSDAHKLLDL